VRKAWQAISLAVFLALLLFVAWPYADQFSAEVLARKEVIPAEAFLLMDPLVGAGTAIAGRVLGRAVVWAVVVLLLCSLLPRGFCSHVCPLGTTIGAFDRAVGRWFRRLHRTRRGWWVHLKYYLLAAILLAAVIQVTLVGYVAAVPLATRGYAFILNPVQTALLKHPGMVRPEGWTYWLGVGLFVGVVGLGVLGRRFWCRYLCPTGALFSVGTLLRLRDRHVSGACIECGRCVDACPFDAINDDFSTRVRDCASCPECVAVCPVDAISFGKRGGFKGVASGPAVSRRGFIEASAAGVLCAAGVSEWSDSSEVLRPPGSVDEKRFLQLCVRCGKCMKVCPGPVLHPAGLETGINALWTPVAVPTWAGCHQECNFCGHVCPTGAILPLAIEAKKQTSMGLAIIDTQTCRPYAGEEDCQLCYEECQAAGYEAIEMREIELDVGDIPEGVMSPMDMEAASSILAPFVDAGKCVGCGLCEYRCNAYWVKHRGEVAAPPIAVVAEGADRP
jgi:NAD-dependent dihydropyrimidine dehydrogenase PreA subunit